MDQKLHLGGPESEERLVDRQARYLTYHHPGGGEMLRIAVDGVAVGSVGYWEIVRDGAAYETGWAIVPAYQGRGLGSMATRLLMERLKPIAAFRYVFAFPSPANPGSNGICRKVGFELMGIEEMEYPKGVWSAHNVWRLDLRQFSPLQP